MATLGDPLADLGYLCATWAEPEDHGKPDARPIGRDPRRRLPRPAPSCALATPSAPVAISHDHRWYEVLALWKAAIFLEASYRRYLAGNTDDPYFATLRDGIPAIAADALDRTR